MRKPPITITCDCGETHQVPYGERWSCERCDRSWNTQQIPAEEYEVLLRRMQRLRLEAIALALAAILIPLIVFVERALIFVVPVVAAAWLFIYVPRWRRKTRRAARNTPRWELHPE